MEGCDLVSAGQVRAACDQLGAAVKRPANPVEAVGRLPEKNDEKISWLVAAKPPIVTFT